MDFKPLVRRADNGTDVDTSSVSSLVTTFVPLIAIAGVWLTAFLVLRPRYSWKYAPRTNSKVLRPEQYSKPLSSSLLGWFGDFWKIPEHTVLQAQSLDAFLFLRFLKICIVISLVGIAMTWPVLFPVYATGKAGLVGLNILTSGNIAPSVNYTNNFRYFAPALMAWVFFGFIMFMITRETIYYINLRQAYLMNPAYAAKTSARTVLYTSVPANLLEESKIRAILGPSVKRVWFPSDTDKLDDLVEERDKAAFNLEGAETKLILTANGNRLKHLEKVKKGKASADDAETAHAENDVNRWLGPKDRPTHRLKLLIGKKVDSIEHSRAELERLPPLIDAERAIQRSGEGKKLPSVFVEFNTLADAQQAYQSLTHHLPLKMAPRFTGMTPSEIIWSNLKITGAQRFVRVYVITAFVIALIIFWSIPVAFVGFISNIKKWTDPTGPTPWLSFLNKLPPKIFGLVSGLAPSVLLAVLMAILPPFLRFCAKLSGAPTLSAVEYRVSNYYFGFQIVQVFLVATLSSAASSAAISILGNPSIVFSLLSASIPAASNLYLSYFLVQGLGVVSGLLTAISGLVVTPLLAKFLGSTPRKLFLRWNGLNPLSYGTVFPIYVNLLVIAITYSVIAPLVIGFSAIGISFFYVAYRYNILYVYDTGPDTKGLLYARALRQLFVGLYIAEICLIGLLATSLGKDAKGGIGPFILLILLLIFTALYNVALSSAVGPLMDALPKDLEVEERRIQALAKGETFEEVKTENGESSIAPTSTAKAPNMFTKFLKPHIYQDYEHMRRLMPEHITSTNPADDTLYHDAYLAPSVWSEVPRLVIPRDPMGFSGPEVLESGKVIPITDAGAIINDKNKIIVDDDVMGDLYFKEKDQVMKNEFS